MENARIYIDALEDVITKKTVVFGNLYNVVEEQEKVLLESEVDLDYFHELMDKKQGLINEIEELDKSFEKLYLRVQEELTGNKDYYKDDIISLQEKIREITSLGVKVKVIEQQNKTKVDYYLQSKKNNIKSFNANSNTASKYTQNMANQNYGQSYFYDKKK